MNTAQMDEKYIHIAELSEQIEKINGMIALHQEQTSNQSMIRQYAYKRDELIRELQSSLQLLRSTVQLAAA